MEDQDGDLHIPPITDACKYKRANIECQYQEGTVDYAERLQPYICHWCFKEGGMCKQNNSMSSFFKMKIVDDSNPYRLVIPCWVRDRVHALGVSSIKIKSITQTIHHVGLYKDKYKRLFANGAWPEFIAENGQNKRCKMDKGYNTGERVCPSVIHDTPVQRLCRVATERVVAIQDVEQPVHEREVQSQEEEHAVAARDDDAHPLVSFSLHLTPSHMNSMLRISKVWANRLEVPESGEVDLIMDSPHVTVPARYRVLNSQSRRDGRLAVTSGWKEFVGRSGLQEDGTVKVDISRVNGKLTFCFVTCDSP
ncbi:uncharacterized protein LOC123397474 isoform X2 [Hordeum vulgare subsp. vulgare]|uniref:uncharacterized protein LOC123397474 isoform X2 n=1 Tax=Hordeum vulgare subsp. vulgare TaxID=112509 RepID=UPI001D1A5354|nr:uncharacterized protein LOC123397474 isoform X2 [Hordeum vulgare subsp. vulgare]